MFRISRVIARYSCHRAPLLSPQSLAVIARFSFVIARLPFVIASAATRSGDCFVAALLAKMGVLAQRR
jgi:hypothetical protein